jgi:Type VI secretion system/phage-baseplate injector OB domain
MNGDNEANCKKLVGKYQGVVISNIDPLTQGRLLVKVPDLLGDTNPIWAESASPLSGRQMGMYFVPPVDTGVWIEFQHGSPDYPIWTGCWRGSQIEIPAAALKDPPATPPIIIQSEAQNKIIVSGLPNGGVVLETALGPLGPRIEMDAMGITISAGKGKITIKGSVVDINDNALTIIGA